MSRHNTVGCRVGDESLLLLDAVAGKNGLSRAEYIKMVVEEAISKELSR